MIAVQLTSVELSGSGMRSGQGHLNPPLQCPPPPPPLGAFGPFLRGGESRTKARTRPTRGQGVCRISKNRRGGGPPQTPSPSPASRPADPVLWSRGSALTLCITSRTVHRRPCVSDTVARCGTCGGCHCVRVSADTPPTALRRASVPARQDHE